MPLQVKVCDRQKTGGFFGPFAHFQTGLRKHVSEACVFPFLRVFEAVKIKMPHLQWLT